MTPQERAAAVLDQMVVNVLPRDARDYNEQVIENALRHARRAALLEQRELLMRVDMALTDWLRCYAPEEFTEGQLAETRGRLHGGTLFYIADLRRDLKDILTRLAQEG